MGDSAWGAPSQSGLTQGRPAKGMDSVAQENLSQGTGINSGEGVPSAFLCEPAAPKCWPLNAWPRTGQDRLEKGTGQWR